MQMTVANQLREKLQEKGEQQQADVHAVDIGISRDHHAVVSQVFDALLDVERGLQQCKLLVFVHHFTRKAEGVERLATKRENRLRFDIATLGNRSRCGVTLGDEDRRFQSALVLGVEMHPAVAEFLVVHLCLTRSFAGNFLHTLEVLAFALGRENPLLDRLGDLRVFVKVIVEMGLEEIADEGPQRLTLGNDGRRSEFCFRLRFENRLHNAHAHCGFNARTDVRRIVLFFVKPAHDLDQCLAECGEVGAPL